MTTEYYQGAGTPVNGELDYANAMRNSASLRCVDLVLAAALVSGCGSHSALAPPADAPQARNAAPGNQTFGYTGHAQLFTVPAGIHDLLVVARGAGGSPGGSSCGTTGRGARVYALIPVAPGQNVHAYVGGTTVSRRGGFSGGGGGGGGYYGGGGGGAGVIAGHASGTAGGGGGGSSFVERRAAFSCAGTPLNGPQDKTAA